ncbi:AIM24 family protein [candidate division KSB1 bacterium]
MEFEILSGKERGKNGNLCDLLKASIDRGDSFFSEKQLMMDMSTKAHYFTEWKMNFWMHFMLRDGFFWQHYIALEDGQDIKLTKDAPGRIIEEFISEDNQLICHPKSFFAAESQIKPVFYNLLNIHYQKRRGDTLRRLFFASGIDFAFYDFQGQGKVFVDSDGDYTKIELEKGERRIVDPDYIIMFSKNMKVRLKSPNEIGPEDEKFLRDHEVYSRAMRGRRWDLGNYILNGIFKMEFEGPGTVYRDTISEHPEEGGNIFSGIKDIIASRVQ